MLEFYHQYLRQLAILMRPISACFDLPELLTKHYYRFMAWVELIHPMRYAFRPAEQLDLPLLPGWRLPFGKVSTPFRKRLLLSLMATFA